MLTALYTLLIGPLQLFFELFYAVVNRIVQNPGVSIIVLSLAMNFLVLPLYKRADAMQEEERQTEAHLKKWTAHIKKTFKGDERFMILQTYYRQNDYKPTDALKGSVSLLLEIPFFIAAYNFLSHLQLLNGFSFGPIQNLGQADGLLVLGGVAINVLPILMTAINLVSSAIYTKGLPLHSKIQLYGMAAIFLVLLYDSPAGLVFYWTLNNLFSLAKNIFYRLKNPKLVLCSLCSLCGAGLLAFVLLIHPMGSARKQVFMIALLLLLQLPLLIYILAKKAGPQKEVLVSKVENYCFYAGCVFMAVLTGLVIPASLLKASPEEFISKDLLHNPLLHVWNASLLAFGLFVIWFGIFYMLAAPRAKRLMSLGIWVVCGAALTDYMFFGKNESLMSANLVFEEYLPAGAKMQLLNLLVLAAVAAVFYILWRKKAEIVKTALTAACIALTVMSAVNMSGVYAASKEKIEQLSQLQASETGNIPLSRDGKNVILIMLDRAINSYVPYMFREKPELEQQFAGFTYYPNTISYGTSTNFGSPALYGGYEYTPEEMNKRDTELLEDKHNEALKVMPVLFSNSGFETTVCDPTYAGYDWIPDLSIYDEYPDIRKYITIGKYNINDKENALRIEKTRNRSFFCYSLFKAAPLLLQPNLYNNGLYNKLEDSDLSQLGGTEQVFDGLSKAWGRSQNFLSSYNVLEHLPQMTHVDAQGNTFFMMSNDTTHEPALLQKPDYKPADFVDNQEYDAQHSEPYEINGRVMRMENEEQVIHYHANMGSFLMIGQWLDHLREQGVYDNTRIIIASDHGFNLAQFDDMHFGSELHQDVMWFNPLLMVKDFNSSEFTTDNTFMTNADVPALMTEGLIDQPQNPFTGKAINSDKKKEPVQHVFFSDKFDTKINNGTTFLPGQWYSVQDDIFDMNHWQPIEDPLQ